MDGGSDRDLRAEARSAGGVAQLTALASAAHSPDACADTFFSDISYMKFRNGEYMQALAR